MRSRSHSYPKRAIIGLVTSLAIGFAVIAICNMVRAIAGDFPTMRLWGDESPTQILLASFPYLTLSICGITARRPWIVAICLTAAFWGYYLWNITHVRGVGANIGLGIVMLVSPIPILGGSLLSLATLAHGRKTDKIPTDR